MKGEVLHYDDNQGVGQISGDDGIRYNFTRADLKQLIPISRGSLVDFDFEGKQAHDIYVINATPAAAPAPAAPTATTGVTGQQPIYTGPVEPDRGLWGYYIRTLTANYANFSGRSRRKEYWGFALFSIIIYLVLGGIMAAGFHVAQSADGTSMPAPSPLFYVGAGLIGIYALATLLPSIALVVRRLHDIGWSGWIALVIFVLGAIPYLGIIGGIVALVVACINSQPFVNKFGPPPKAVA